MGNITISWLEAREKAALLHQAARSDDPQFCNAVYGQHRDGSTVFFFGAYLVQLSPDYDALITEHHGWQVVVRSEMHFVMEFEQAEFPPVSFDKKLKQNQKLKEKYEKALEEASRGSIKRSKRDAKRG